MIINEYSYKSRKSKIFLHYLTVISDNTMKLAIYAILIFLFLNAK